MNDHDRFLCWLGINKYKPAGMKLDDLIVYQKAMNLAEKIWAIVISWETFSKHTLGKQWVNAADSIGQNIAEGYGRYHYKDSENFYYYARGSLYESLTILRKANSRNLISPEFYPELDSEHRDLLVRLNNFIASVGNRENPL